MIASLSAFSVTATDNLQARFLSLLPKIERCARFYFRHITCSAKRTDRIAETVALCWKWFVRLAERGRDAAEFVTTLVALAARAVNSGRRLCKQESAVDVMSNVAQHRHGFNVESLPIATRRSHESINALVRGQEELDAYEERLSDNAVTPPPDAAAFRIDFPRFLGRMSERDRALAMFLSLGHTATKAADKFGLSCGRVTQLRQRWHENWRLFEGEEPREESGQSPGGQGALAIA
jgi:hypothetical protein